MAESRALSEHFLHLLLLGQKSRYWHLQHLHCEKSIFLDLKEQLNVVFVLLCMKQEDIKMVISLFLCNSAAYRENEHILLFF